MTTTATTMLTRRVGQNSILPSSADAVVAHIFRSPERARRAVGVGGRRDHLRPFGGGTSLAYLESVGFCPHAAIMSGNGSPADALRGQQLVVDVILPAHFGRCVVMCVKKNVRLGMCGCEGATATERCVCVCGVCVSRWGDKRREHATTIGEKLTATASRRRVCWAWRTAHTLTHTRCTCTHSHTHSAAQRDDDGGAETSERERERLWQRMNVNDWRLYICLCVCVCDCDI